MKPPVLFVAFDKVLAIIILIVANAADILQTFCKIQNFEQGSPGPLVLTRETIDQGYDSLVQTLRLLTTRLTFRL